MGEADLVITRPWQFRCGGSVWMGSIELLDTSGRVARRVARLEHLAGQGGLRVEQLDQRGQHSLIHQPQYPSRTLVDDRLQVFELEGDALVDRVDGLIFAQEVYVRDVEGDGVKELIVTLAPTLNSADNELGVVRRGADGRWRLDAAPPSYESVKAVFHEQLRAPALAAPGYIGVSPRYRPDGYDPYTEAQLQRLVRWLSPQASPLEYELQLHMWLAARAARIELRSLEELALLVWELPASKNELSSNLFARGVTYHDRWWTLRYWLEAEPVDRIDAKDWMVYRQRLYIPDATTHTLRAIAHREGAQRAWAVEQLTSRWRSGAAALEQLRNTPRPRNETTEEMVASYTKKQRLNIKTLEIEDALASLRDPSLLPLYEQMWRRDGETRLEATHNPPPDRDWAQENLNEPLASTLIDIGAPAFVREHIVDRRRHGVELTRWGIFSAAPARACRLQPPGWDLRAYCDPAAIAAALDRDVPRRLASSTTRGGGTRHAYVSSTTAALQIIELLGAHGEERHLPALRAAARLLAREALGTAVADAAIARVEARLSAAPTP
jgi:hypothetical protein